jgi:hypothetical protein
MIVSCDAGSRSIRSSATSRALLDAVIVRLCLLERFASAATLLSGQSGSNPGKKEPARVR